MPVISISCMPANWYRNEKYKDYVYIGRKTKVLDSIFGNPYHVGYIYRELGYHTSISEYDAITLYKEWLYNKIIQDKEFRMAVKNLHAKILVCWCKVAHNPETCHAEVLVETARELNGFYNELSTRTKMLRQWEEHYIARLEACAESELQIRYKAKLIQQNKPDMTTPQKIRMQLNPLFNIHKSMNR